MLSNRRESQIYKICLTGGPCSGKTVALNHLRAKFADKYSVLVIPEICTSTSDTGFNINPSRFTEETKKAFNYSLCRYQIDIETYYESLAALMDKPVLLIADRGVVDNFGYLPAEIKRSLMEENHWDMNAIRNERYDLVIHMVTAAFGADEFYTTLNNEARSETQEEARVVDKCVLDEWLGYPNLLVIDNMAKGMEAKLERLEHCIKNLVEGSQLETKTVKLLLDKIYSQGDLPSEIITEGYEETAYSKTPSSNIYVKRSYKADGLSAYFSITRCYQDKSGAVHEIKRLISETEFKAAVSIGTDTQFSKDVIAFSAVTDSAINFYQVETFETSKGAVSVLRLDKDVDNDNNSPILPFMKVQGVFTPTTNFEDGYLDY